MNHTPETTDRHDQVRDRVRAFVGRTYPDASRERVSDDDDLYLVVASSLFRNQALVFVRVEVAPAKVPPAMVTKRNFATINAMTNLIVSLTEPGDTPPAADAGAAEPSVAGGVRQP